MLSGSLNTRQKRTEFNHKVMNLRHMQNFSGYAQHLAELYLETKFSSLYISNDCRISSQVFGNVSEKMIQSVCQIIFIKWNTTQVLNRSIWMKLRKNKCKMNKANSIILVKIFPGEVVDSCSLQDKILLILPWHIKALGNLLGLHHASYLWKWRSQSNRAALRNHKHYFRKTPYSINVCVTCENAGR